MESDTWPALSKVSSDCKFGPPAKDKVGKSFSIFRLTYRARIAGRGDQSRYKKESTETVLNEIET